MGPDNISKLLLLFFMNNLRRPNKMDEITKKFHFSWDLLYITINRQVPLILQLKDRSHETKKKVLNFNIWMDLFINLIIPKILFKIDPIKYEKTH